MQCQACGAESPDEKKFCAECGAPLQAPQEVIVRRHALAVFEEQFKKRDQKLLEVETADAIYARLSKAAIPAAFALAIVAFVGYSKYNNLLDAMKVAESQAVQRLQGQEEQEADQIKGVAASQKSSLQANAEKENQALQGEASRMRTENVKSSEELRAELRQLKAGYDQAKTQVADLMQQGTTLKKKYDDAGTQLANLQGSAFVSNTSLLSGTLSDHVSLPTSLGTTNSISALLLREPRIYSVGSSGAEVEQIQGQLKSLGCYDGPVNGHYDEATKQSVERFNRARGEAFPSGVVDEIGWSYLFSALVFPSSPNRSSGALTVSGSQWSPTNLGLPVPGAARCSDEKQ